MHEEIVPMEDTMEHLYEEIILIQKFMDPLIGIQKNAQEVLKILNIENGVVGEMQEWTTKYLDAPQHLGKKDNNFAEIERVHMIVHLKNQSNV